ncbi:putative S-layer protein [Candidatus Woesearchaeota archaeon]|nr:putative S-layer protein [Candidatus Woesearchaeota archaeon]MBT6023526.1 putative S-layer protein [Candidatus Woesearchaeota archaeon]
MVNMKKLISGALVVLIGLMSFSVAFAAPTGSTPNGYFTVEESITDITVVHGTSVSGTIEIVNLVGDTGDATFTIATTTALPTGATVTYLDDTGTALTGTNTNEILVADDSTEVVTFTITVALNTAPITSQAFTFDIANDIGSDAVSLPMTITVPSDDSRVITEESLSDSIVRSDATTTNSVTLTATVQNTGNENVVVSQTLGSLANAVTENTYFDLNDLILNWNNEKNLSVSGATITLPTTGTNSNTITPGNSQEFIITIPTALTDKYGVYTSTLSLMDDVATSISRDTAPVSVEIADSNNVETITINEGSYGDILDESNDDSKTYPGDNMLIEDIRIHNDVGEDLENIVVTVIIYNSGDGSEAVDEYEFDDFNLRDGKKEYLNYEFQLPFDITEDTYVISYLVEAEGEDTGTQYSNRAYDTFDVEQDSRHLVIEEFTTGSYCPGDVAVEFKVKIANVGTSDISQNDEIKVSLTSKGFSLDETINYDTKLRSESSKIFTFNVDIPADASGSNLMEISVAHDSDKDASDDGSSLSQSYVLSDNCIPVSGASGTDVKGTMSGVLTSTGNVDESTSYALLVYNTGSSSATYTIEVSGVSGWGTSLVEPTTDIVVASGEFSTFYVHLTPSESASESNSAVITLKSGSEIIDTNTLTMNVEKSSSSTYTNALLGSTFAELGESEDLITLLSLAIILLVSFGTVYAALQGTGTPTKKNRKTKKERK